ncbi:MAG: PHB depolymerase family esterase [Bdellovibrionota bacterium]
MQAVFKFLMMLALTVGLQARAQEKAIDLPSLQVWPNVTVSGISSGAFFAVQLHLAHSEIIQGVASIAGGPWNCAQGSVTTAQIECMMIPNQIDVSRLVQQANTEAGKGSLAALDNISDDKVYLFGSPADGVVKKPAVDKLAEFYAAIAPEADIKVEQSIESAHGFPTLDFGNKCSQQASPWMQNCAFDTAGELLTHLYTALNQRTNTVVSPITKFSQEPFRAGADLLSEGYIFIPKACSAGKKLCRLHIAFHGCLMNSDAVGDVFASKSGYNNWAETNDIVVLYPQADRSSKNPNGCWDWYGSNSADYANRRGLQIKAVKAMIDRLMRSEAN